MTSDGGSIPPLLTLAWIVLLSGGLVVDAAAVRGLWKPRTPWASRSIDLARTSLASRQFLYVMAALVGVQFLGDGVIARAGLPEPLATITRMIVFHGGIFAAVAAVWQVPVLRPPSGPPLLLRRHDAAPLLGRGALMGIGLFPPVWLAALAGNRLLQALDFPLSDQDVLGLLSNAGTGPLAAGLGILAVIVVPLGEEFLFRGLLLPYLARGAGSLGGVLMSAALFSLFHGHAPSLAPLFVAGLAFGLAYLHSGSIIVPVTMHAIFNLANLASYAALHAAPR